MRVLHIDDKEVKWTEGGRGIFIWGRDINGRFCIVAEHSVDPRLFEANVAFRTGGHTYVMKVPARVHSLD